MCPEPSLANKRYHARTGFLFRIAWLLDQMCGDNAIDYPEHLARDQWAAGKEKTQLEWEAEHPLAHRLMREYLIYQQGRTLGHTPRAVTGAESAAFATERNQALLVTCFTAHTAIARGD